jgi:hypothetical protein
MEQLVEDGVIRDTGRTLIGEDGRPKKIYESLIYKKNDPMRAVRQAAEIEVARMELRAAADQFFVAAKAARSGGRPWPEVLKLIRAAAADYERTFFATLRRFPEEPLSSFLPLPPASP